MSERASARTVTVRFTARAYNVMRRYLFRDANEQVCFLFAQVVESPTRRIFIVDHVITLHPACYLRQSPTGVVVDPRAKNCLYFKLAASPYNGLNNCHSHPFEKGVVRFSPDNDIDDVREMAWQLTELPVGKRSFGQRAHIHALSMVFGQERLDARSYLPGSPPVLPSIDQVQVLGETLRVITPTGVKDRSPELSDPALETYDRQIRAFGVNGQRALGALHVCLVGLGGIGSIAAEGLVRLGVRNMTLIDPDCLDLSNLNRWQGGRPVDVGKPKVEVQAERLREMTPGIALTPIAASLTAPEALMAIKDCDIVIGAVDNHLSRFLLNRLSVQYLIPYMDAASVITRSEAGNGIGLLTRLGVVVPGKTACLDCSRITYYDKKSLVSYLYDPQTRRHLETAGYIDGRPEMKAAAVMPLNMQAASLALTEVLNLVTGFAPLARYARIDGLCTSAQTLRADGSNFAEGPEPDCLGCSALLGRGDSEPLPTIDVARVTGAAEK